MISYEQITNIPVDLIKNLINYYLLEDIPDGDKTSEGIFSNSDKCKAYIEAEDEIVLAGINFIPYFFNDDSSVNLFKTDGNFVKKGDIIAEIYGNTIDILSKERTILNLIQRLSGIATQTKLYCDIANKYDVKILDTRKTTPGLRYFEKYAVVCGGGSNHRANLSKGILIKDNHINAAGGIVEALKSIKSKNYFLPIEVEVENFEQIKLALNEGLDGFLLDNMSPEMTIEAVKIIRSHHYGKNIFIESSGGINLNTLESYCKTGVNAISIGALTHSVRAANIHMEIEV